MSRGSLPLDRGSVDTEILVPSTRMVTPSSACQPVPSSGQLMSMQVDSVIATSRAHLECRLRRYFLLSCEVQTLHGRLASGFHSIVPSRSTIPHGSSRLPGTRRLPGGIQITPRHTIHQPSLRGKECPRTSVTRLLSMPKGSR